MKSLEQHLSTIMANGKKIGVVKDWKISKPMYLEYSHVDAPYAPVDYGPKKLFLAGQYYYTTETPALWKSFRDHLYELGTTMVQLGMQDSFKIELPEQEYNRIVFSMAVTGPEWIHLADKALTLDIFSNFPFWFQIGGPAGPILVGKAR
jgi:hypothetical protein